MGFDPRSWGRPAQAALVLITVARLPAVVGQPGVVAAAGTLTGIVVGNVLLVALGRWLVRLAPWTNTSSESDSQS